jgi:Binding-prot-dependent transport system membrane comp, N-term
VLQALLTRAFVMVFNFFLFRVIPSDSLELLLPGTTAINPTNVEQLTKDLGLAKPLPQQFLIYAQDTLTLNFGDSFSRQSQDVKRVIYHRIWPTPCSWSPPPRSPPQRSGYSSASTAGGAAAAGSTWGRRCSLCSSTRCPSSGSGSWC